MHRALCIHGHFYQPPREDPWLGRILPEGSAAPSRHWNERICRESYAPLARARRLDGNGRIIELLNEREKPMAFILWGSPARRKKAMITNPRHYIVESPHPSPLSASRGFFGSRPFSRVNQFLESCGETPIDWQLPDV